MDLNGLKAYITAEKESFTPLSVSTNRVSRFAYEGKGYILKEQALREDALSPFWQMMKELFSSDFQSQRDCMPKIVRLVSKNPHIPVTRLVLTDEVQKYQVYEEAEGELWEPDEFPEPEETALQLGRFIGFLHGRSYDACGLPGGEPVRDFERRVRSFLEGRAEIDWRGALGGRVERYAEKLREKPLPVSRFVLMMADISANQFVFERGKIRACVDFDAYVIGPAEWELCILRDCVADWAAFQRGYEQYQPLPALEEAELFYPFLMKLLEPWDKKGMEAFFDRQECGSRKRT